MLDTRFVVVVRIMLWIGCELLVFVFLFDACGTNGCSSSWVDWPGDDLIGDEKRLLRGGLEDHIFVRRCVRCL